MDPQLYKNIKECDARSCWPLVKDAVALQLMGPDVIPVPFLIDAPYYDHCSVIVKESLSPIEKLKRKKAGIITIGTIKDFIKDERQTGLLQKIPRTKKAIAKINPSYIFEESDLKNQLRKTIRVEIDECQKYIMENIPGEGSLTVDMASRGFLHVKKIYLVYEVCYANKIVVTVTIGNETDRVEINQQVPIGFKMRRYRLKENGALSEPRDEPNKQTFQWVKRSHFRNPMDALPDPAA